ncbi:MAG TPA: hypothetical protein VGS27_01040 [Candidatus Sulfotelmatobacter sp.]|nr:hypothetical protein [Candidatus Sulfotelmatobacter sp.]
MKLTRSTAVAVFVLGLLCSAQSARPVPPGMRHAQELEAQNEQDLVPPNPARQHNVVQLKSEADQLAELAASVPRGVQNASKGLLEKDLLQKLKRIEKLSKHLRNELDR